MAINYPGPYGLRFFYTVSGRQHKHEVSLDLTATPDFGAQFDEIDVVRRDAVPLPLDDVMGAWLDVVLPLFSAATGTFDRAELWKYTPGTFDAAFVAAAEIGAAGENATAVSPASQAVYTFRTAEGGVMKIDFLDVSDAPGIPQSYAALAANSQALVDFVLADENPWLARDTSYPLAFLRFLPGQNERLWKTLNGR